jgi:hypothetical protein
MAAGLSRKQIHDRIRYRLQRVARENDGTYHNFRVDGVKSGARWAAYYNILRASNGEVAGLLQVEVDGKLLDYPYGCPSVQEALAKKGL